VTLDSFSNILSIILGALSLIGIIWLAAVKVTRIENNLEHLKEDLEGLEDKFDVIWTFLLRRGISEAIHGGNATMNSPVTLTPKAKEIINGLKPELQQLAKQHAGWTDAELALEIEKRWGDFILKQICIPQGLHAGACLIMALEAARGKVDIS